ncbi:MAG: Ig-like domain-containing protein [Lachnospiraceae bacterium]
MKGGNLYWIVSEQEAALEEVKGSANQMAVTAGVNTLKLSELGTAKSGVYLALKDSNGYWSSLAKARFRRGEVIAGITLETTALVMEEGAETNLTAAILPGGTEGKEITWTSDKPGVAAVTGNGKNAVITAAGKSGKQQ